MTEVYGLPNFQETLDKVRKEHPELQLTEEEKERLHENINVGRKDDSDKLRYDLIPISALEGLAEVMTYGANKYGEHNYRMVDKERYVAALFRHLIAYRKGEDNDQESGFHHLKHALSNIAIILAHELEE